MMKNQTIMICIWLVLLGSTGLGDVIIPPSDPNLRYTGRWNFDEPLIPWVGWQGASIIVKFQGTGISVDMSGTHTDQYRVIVNGVPEGDRGVFNSTRNTYILAAGLPDTIHTLEMMKETFYGFSYFYGFEVEGTGIVSQPERPTLRIEFFGDSNMDGSSNYSEKNQGDMGTYYAYPAMVSRMLGAEMNNQSVGGAQLDDNGDNSVGSFIYSEDYYNQDPDYRSGFDPHIIVVNAGANDIGNSKSVVKNRYQNVVSDLRLVYGSDPQIILFNSYGWDINEPANYTQEVVDESGDPNLTVCLFPWLWEQWHGSQWDHSGEAYVLLDHISELNPNWGQINPGDIIDGFGRNWDFANGSFEYSAPFGGFGWRYFTDGVERVYDPSHAPDGDYYIRLNAGEEVHQPTDATGNLLPGATQGGEEYYMSAKIRGVTSGAEAQLITEFQGQQIWTRGNPQTTNFELTEEWQTYTAYATAPAGIWTLFNTFKAVSGTIEIDSVSMSNMDPVGTNNFGEDYLGSPQNNRMEIKSYPNPFNPSVTIEYKIYRESDVSLTIYDVQGREVKKLFKCEHIPGNYMESWSGLDNQGNQAHAGTYFARIKTGNISNVVKLVLLK